MLYNYECCLGLRFINMFCKHAAWFCHRQSVNAGWALGLCQFWGGDRTTKGWWLKWFQTGPIFIHHPSCSSKQFRGQRGVSKPSNKLVHTSGNRSFKPTTDQPILEFIALTDLWPIMATSQIVEARDRFPIFSNVQGTKKSRPMDKAWAKSHSSWEQQNQLVDSCLTTKSKAHGFSLCGVIPKCRGSERAYDL